MMAALTGNDHFILGINSPPKDHTQGTGDPTLTAGDNDISIWINTPPNINMFQQLVGDLHKLNRWVLSNSLKPNDAETWAAIPVGGDDSDIVVAPPGAGEVGLLVGAFTHAADRSHFLDRTFKRLLEKFLEASKIT